MEGLHNSKIRKNLKILNIRGEGLNLGDQNLRHIEDGFNDRVMVLLERSHQNCSDYFDSLLNKFLNLWRRKIANSQNDDDPSYETYISKVMDEK